MRIKFCASAHYSVPVQIRNTTHVTTHKLSVIFKRLLLITVLLKMSWWLIVGIAAIVLTWYKFVFRPYKFWIDRGVPQGSPCFPFGNNWGTIFGTKSFAELVQMVYNISPKSRYSGFYQMTLPILVLKDPELIKQITVKDFDHFTDHRSFIPQKCDSLWEKNLFALTGEKWRAMRTTLSPAFTSNKMKYMFSLISQNGEQFVKHFLKKTEDLTVVEMKDVFTRFTNDVIASTAFGVECNSLEERNNEFYRMGKEATDFTGFWKSTKILGFFFMPKLYQLLRVKVFSKKVSDFFTEIIKTNIETREKEGIVRPDVLNLMLVARREGLKHEDSQVAQDTGFATAEESEIGRNLVKKEITDEDIVSQALIFIFAGFDSVSSLMCFMSYELAINPEVQEKLRKEVDLTFDNCRGKLTYEALLTMKYMDMVVSEALRKWPNNITTDRVCTKPYTIQPENPEEKPVRLEKNAVLWIPVFTLHRDPEHFPDPDRFDPERFSNENKSNIKPYTYLPFGAGPRNCIGSRFALMETKIVFFYLLHNFEIIPVEKTRIPLVLHKKTITVAAKDGFWLGLKRRAK